MFFHLSFSDVPRIIKIIIHYFILIILLSNKITPLSKMKFLERMSNLITLLFTFETFKHDMNDDSFSLEEVK